jgi:membrane-associated protease RseP (regulator of RpoE activity)
MRIPFVLAVSLTSSLLLPLTTTVSAQSRDGADTGRAGRLERRPDEPDGLMRIVMNRRARLGIKVNLQARETDSLGAYVQSVTPNGPAARAGIRSGDLITKLDGKSVLAGGQAELQADARQSPPGLRLIELAARLEPNDTVKLEFLRGKDRKTVSLVTEDEPEMFADGPGGPGGPRVMIRRFGPGDDERLPVGDFLNDAGPGDRFEFWGDGPLGDLELAPLNPDLGAYFGTTDGVLVIRSPKDGRLGLKGGDIVQAVDGRKPASPAHLLRILRSYDRGETFKLDILRNRKQQTVSARLDGRDG